MKYDFDKVLERRGTGALKWEVAEQELPMWVADMDFKAAPEIQEAVRKKVEEGVFGYSAITEEWYPAIMNWWQKRYQFDIQKEWLVFCNGVMPAISSAIRRLTAVRENVLIQTPVYNQFVNVIINNGRRVIENPLKYKDGAYFIDFEDLEKKLSNPKTTMMILCNPHNPVGKIWDRDTLIRIGELCARHDVIVVSDEIHCDLTIPGKTYIPFASVSERCAENSITCAAPTKTFNLAGLQTAVIMIPDIALRYEVRSELDQFGLSEPNSFAISSAAAAYEKGEAWLGELMQYVFENRQLVTDYVEREIPRLKVVEAEATYLVWMDCSGLSGDTIEFCDFLREETGLFISRGDMYGGNGKNFFRMNIACPRVVLQDGLDRLKNGVEAYLVRNKKGRKNKIEKVK